MTVALRLELFPADLDAFADFWCGVLAFGLERDERQATVPYLAVRRSAVRIGAAARPGAGVPPVARRPPAGVEIVLEVEDLDRERERVAAAGWPVEEDVRMRPWGLRDFRLLDPDGHYVRITTG
ncbi:VOC family protein [Nakamurella endophytica]|uniref:VOC domain-containing protein n=1 Tax=Nakamurella endophytica TaxID=1748367 RepID=A0A917T8E5_9ACTN|nr:VOC family protein [Nakamurella endophytica]GGM13624.1 hypothetical protein GCM10011594_36920 [Nakamurella endophytica]